MAEAEVTRPELTGPQKAAAVVVSLGAEKASLIYQYVEPSDLETLTLEVARLGMLDARQTEDVLSEFYQNCMTQKAVTEGGLEYARTVLEKAFGVATATSLLEKVTKSLKNREFAFLDKADVKSLYSALQNERPQTMALVLSYVDPSKAAGVIEQLPPERQVRVVESIATMESASPAAIKIIEAEMEKKFSSMLTTSNVKVGGIDYVAGIMNNLDRSSEKSIFDGLNKLFMNMSARMAESIRDDLEITTNVRMKDVEDAQQRIVGIIRDLEEKNEIVILKGGKDDIIA